MTSAPMNKSKGPKGSGRSGVKRSKGSSLVPNGMGSLPPGASGPMGIPPSAPGGPAAPMQQPQMPGQVPGM